MGDGIQNLSVTDETLVIGTANGAVFIFHSCDPVDMVGPDASTLTIDKVVGDVYVLHASHLGGLLDEPITIRGSQLVQASDVVRKEGAATVSAVKSGLVRVHSGDSAAQAVTIRHVTGNIVSERGLPTNIRIDERDKLVSQANDKNSRRAKKERLRQKEAKHREAALEASSSRPIQSRLPRGRSSYDHGDSTQYYASYRSRTAGQSWRHHRTGPDTDQYSHESRRGWPSGLTYELASSSPTRIGLETRARRGRYENDKTSSQAVPRFTGERAKGTAPLFSYDDYNENDSVDFSTPMLGTKRKMAEVDEPVDYIPAKKVKV
ncbi:hypothetical protein ACHAQA_000472 [Verticillium albo-atrum]